MKAVKFTIEATVFADESEIESIKEAMSDLVYDSFDSTNIKVKSRLVHDEDEEQEDME